MSRLGCKYIFRNNHPKKDLKQELHQLVIDPTVSINTVFGDAVKNREWMPTCDKVKISNKRKQLKIRKIIGGKEMDLENFMVRLICIVHDHEFRQSLRLNIGFSWIITDENNKTEYVACRRSKLIDDWAFKVDFSSKTQLLEQIKDMNLCDLNGTIHQAIDDHVFEDDCSYRIAANVTDQDVTEAVLTILANKQSHLRCGGQCAYKKFKSPVAMYVLIEYK